MSEKKDVNIADVDINEIERQKKGLSAGEYALSKEKDINESQTDIKNNIEDKKHFDCVDFLSAVKVCLGDYIIVKASLKAYQGIVIGISPYAIVLNDEHDSKVIIRLKYISSIEVIENEHKPRPK